LLGGSVLSTPQQAYREQQVIEEIPTKRLANLMVQHGFSQNPNAEKWKDIKIGRFSR